MQHALRSVLLACLVPMCAGCVYVPAYGLGKSYPYYVSGYHYYTPSPYVYGWGAMRWHHRHHRYHGQQYPNRALSVGPYVPPSRGHWHHLREHHR